MAIETIDHIYVETAQWEASVDFWEGLGFAFAEQWGTEGYRAGRLTASSSSVVLAEVVGAQPPAFNVFFALTDAEGFQPGPGVNVTTPLEQTHWGTRWIRVEDPDGRVFCLVESTGDG